MNKKKRKRHLSHCLSVLCLSVCALLLGFTTTTTCLDMMGCPWRTAKVAFSYSQEMETRKNDKEVARTGTGDREMERRYLNGPGSSPPRCKWKCGKCTPCKPVHVPVPPGTPVTAEYYPEAWRCKCGNKLYMP
ncbi:hypothetical protein RJ641_032672 [Dillenia turbinata]|uniref:Epidermal patterning factor-like protein n=1 Tax=Dillenia turbinata TaxID=194707 RepID=A0AAN8ZFA2_9MAGN